MAAQHSNNRTPPSFSAVQGVLGGVVLLVALIMRLIGGPLYEDLRAVLTDCLTDQAVADTISAWVESLGNA